MIGLPWLLVDETIDDGDNVVAACADIDGLFASVATPPLERYTLLDCRPSGRLRAAGDDTGPLWVGNIGLEAASSPDLDLELLDVTVVSARRSSRHGPVSLEVSARVRAWRSPDESGYKMAGVGFDEDFGVCGGISGPPPRATPPPRPATLIGCRPGTRLQRAIDATSRNRRWVHASIFTVAHDGTATRLLDAGLGAEVGSVRPSALGDGLVDVEFQPTYADAVGPPRPLGAREVWKRWRSGRPGDLGTWAGYDRELRQEWAGAALAHHQRTPDDGTVFELDGRHITDEEGFYCAIGEAVNGPGGYFGWNLGALHDCLQGGWGAAPGFRLIWHDAAVATASLKPGYDRRWWAPALTMDQLLGLLAADGVEVDMR
ncbi:hypothetical protein ACTI_00900 [Actinoplanes sp. OR16]|uniref:barstar family protein n=1 Tax=Actinoplanes sp. OR16 TaxID=946334 RepID=UPI000F720726|nr:barstar family protein [Actinoplanes sp. OR16]BBH63405.1 hypothetical protein ACTI_00900 [Actinoplanes sp. OR16]